jgi:hypothetical protein
VLEHLEAADGSGAPRIAPPEIVEGELDRQQVLLATKKDGHVQASIPVEDLADFVRWSPGRMAKVFSHARLLS